MGTKEDGASCHTNNNISSSSQGINMHNDNDKNNINNNDDQHVSSLVHNLTILKEKFHHLQSLVTDLDSPGIHHVLNQHKPSSSSSSSQQITSSSNIMAPMANITSLVQEVIVTASSMMFTCQQLSIIDDASYVDRIAAPVNECGGVGGGQGLFSCDDAQNIDCHGDSTFSNNNNNNFQSTSTYNNSKTKENPSNSRRKEVLINNCDIIEMDASDLLAKYTHYCQICGKGFKRDANLRMHMRAHGGQYMSTAALSKKSEESEQRDELSSLKVPRKYSCPQEGCRWNSKHVRFQPLKSIICVKNHYKRSHCPKMYTCKRCSQKQFSVLSDLRTHEKHCGDLKWLCSCGTTFSRKDKLMGHVALFVGHSPATSSSSTMNMHA